MGIDGAPQVASAPTLKQAADGTLTLKATDAEITGNAQLETKSGNEQNIGHWTSTHDFVEWTLNVTKPGRAEENSPPIHRWVGRFGPASPGRDGRSATNLPGLLPSLTGLVPFASARPGLKRWAIFFRPDGRADCGGAVLEGGGKRSATPLWLPAERFAVPAQTLSPLRFLRFAV